MERVFARRCINALGDLTEKLLLLCGSMWIDWVAFNTLRPGQNGHHFPDAKPDELSLFTGMLEGMTLWCVGEMVDMLVAIALFCLNKTEDRKIWRYYLHQPHVNNILAWKFGMGYILYFTDEETSPTLDNLPTSIFGHLVRFSKYGRPYWISKFWTPVTPWGVQCVNSLRPSDAYMHI